MKIDNKPLFWTGMGFYIVEFLVAGIFGLTLLDWSWFTMHILKIMLGIVALIFYNALPGLLIYNSFKKDKKKKKK